MNTVRLWTMRWAVGSLLFLALAAAQEGTPPWLEAMRADFQQIQQARSNQGALHRALVQKWDREGRLDALIAEYETRLSGQPDDPTLLYGAGYAYARRGAPEDLQRAEALLLRATTADPRFALAFFSLGGVRVQLGDLDGAVEAYQQCIQLNPKFAVAYQALGEVYRRQGRYEEALSSYNAALEARGKEWAPPYVGIGLVREAQGEFSLAAGNFEHALRLQPDLREALLGLARVQARVGSVEKAFALYERAEARRPLDGAAWKELGDLLAERGESGAAEKAYRRGIAVDPGLATLHFALGELLWARGERAEAVAAYRAALEQDPTLQERFLEPVRKQFFAGTLPVDRARDLLDRLLAVDPQSLEAHELYAQVETASGRLEEAVGHYEAVLEQAPERTDLRWTLGDLYFALGRVEAARATLRQAAKQDPATADRYAKEGMAAFEKEDFAAAVPAFQKHLLIWPDDATVRYTLARAWEIQGKLDEAIAALEHLRKTAPDTRDALERLARLYHRRGDGEAALAVLDELIARRPEHVGAYWTRGQIQEALENVESAVADYRTVVRLNPDHADAWESLGRLLEERDPASAEEAYRKVIALAPERAMPYFRLSRLLLDQGNKDEAISLLTKGLELQPRRAREQFLLASLLDEAGRLDEALPHYAAAVQIKDDEPDWWYAYARCAHRLADAANAQETQPEESPGQGTPDEDAAVLVETADRAYSRAIQLQATADAFFYRGLLRRTYKQIGGRLYLSSEIAEDFQQVLALRPDDPDALFQLGLTFLDMEEDDQAEATFRRLLRLHPRYPGVHQALGQLAEAKRDYKAAIRLYEQELRIDPKAALAHFRLGFLYTNAKGDPWKGAEHFEQAVSLDPGNVEAHIEYGRALYQLDRLRAAAEQFEQAVRLDPKNPTANYNLALMYQFLGKRQLAIERWKYLLTLDLPGAWKEEARGYLEQLQQQ